MKPRKELIFPFPWYECLICHWWSSSAVLLNNHIRSTHSNGHQTVELEGPSLIDELMAKWLAPGGPAYDLVEAEARERLSTQVR